MSTAIVERREGLIEAGERLFSRYGYRDVSIEDIAGATGLATGSFYNYFRTKEAFYEEILDRIEARGIAEARRVIAGFRSPMNQLKALYRFITLALRRNAILRGILTDNRRYTFRGAAARQSRRTSILAEIEQLIDQILVEGTKKRTFRAGIYRNPKAMLVMMFNALLARFDSDDVQQLTEDMLMLVERGLKRRLSLRKRDERRDRRAARKRT